VIIRDGTTKHIGHASAVAFKVTYLEKIKRGRIDAHGHIVLPLGRLRHFGVCPEFGVQLWRISLVDVAATEGVKVDFFSLRHL
jgi:hypothetical protein